MEHRTQCDAEKPTVIGLYGLPGCGKSTMLRSAKDRFGTQSFDFLEGSDAIADVVPGGLEAFKALPAIEKVDLREKAIFKVAKEAVAKGCVAVLAGHCSFWPAIDDTISWIFTEADASTYTHIIYLNTAAERIHEQCRSDSEKERETLSLCRLTEWQEEEKRRLREECYEHGILFSIVCSTGSKSDLEQVCRLIDDFGNQTQEANMSSIETALTAALNGRTIETMLVFDGDRTISVEDTGSMFWNQVAKLHHSADLCDALKTLFGSNLQYTYRAFEQCRILYEDTINKLGQAAYDQICDEVAMAVTILPEVHALLQLSADVEHVGALVVTCGQSRIWKKIMERVGLSGKVQVIGGGCLSDGFVVTPAVKRAVVSRLQHMHQNYVWAFGDSPLDLDMLQEADEAIVVVGDAHTRSQSVEDSLRRAVTVSGSTFRQMLVPRDVTPRLNTAEIPLVRVEDIEDDIKSRFVTHATDKAAAKLLMTPTRDARLSGPALRNAHHSVGWYLAVEYLTEVVGVEPYAIPHPKSGTTDGHQLLQEAKTLIVAIMRGGEPMALGVNDVIPKAMFKHANEATDLTDAHLKGVTTIILVDSVVNEGVTVRNFVEHIRDAQPSIRIVIIAGVIQSQSVSVNGSLRALARKHRKLHIIALRISGNKYTGSGTSDTGNRLFNTTHFDK